MGFAAAIVLALDTLEAATLSFGELGIVCLPDIGPVHAEVDAVVPDEVLLFLLIGGSEFATFPPYWGGPHVWGS